MSTNTFESDKNFEARKALSKPVTDEIVNRFIKKIKSIEKFVRMFRINPFRNKN